ncbi:platelet glycoprotein Ib beta chain isoform X2 [Alosa sapidissima]|nr:platelet glycoprotein Ib beta chain isoform X2 [Alosa sapidissima]XP_041956816.1 platelet glycoprotein Ib beta chain isoform X2 [Alosa sapidissima]XP_041956817.1 platelet glycoprotein Ib beta chain isoform X2 [Alosa sapidissima]XP_041956818.1 platelet glycoprotein Ib beta chain isoform X2 [Alosa sapidissima]
MGLQTGCVIMSMVFSIMTAASAAVEACPSPCSCIRSVVDCSRRGLTTSSMPTSFPAGTTELRLYDNRLTALPVGVLDALTSLRSVSLHGNPWSCDCGILYLRGWLLKQRNDGLIRNVSCSSPPGLQGTLVVNLVEHDLLSSCRYWFCDLALASQISLIIFIIIQALLLASVIFFLRRFDRLSKEARQTTEESIAGGDSGDNEYVMLKDRST